MSDDLYTILGVTRDATRKQIKKAYSLIAMECHPDRTAHMKGLSGSQKEERRMRFIHATEAFVILSDGKRRATYDAMTGRAPRPTPSPRRPRPAPKAKPPPPRFDWKSAMRMMEEERYKDLFTMCRDPGYDYASRVRLGKSLAEHLVQKGYWEWLARLADAPVPEEVRDEAYCKLPELMQGSITPNMHRSFIIMSRQPLRDKATRRQVGLRVVSIYHSKGLASHLVTLATADGVPDDVRDAAYCKLPGLMRGDVDTRIHDVFMKMTMDAGRGEDIRLKAGLEAVEAFAAKALGDRLVQLASSPGVPQGLRDAAFERLPCLIFDKLPVRSHRLLYKLAGDPGISESSRIRGGMKVVEAYARFGFWGYLSLIAKSTSLPLPVCNNAFDRLPDLLIKTPDFGLFKAIIDITLDDTRDAGLRQGAGIRAIESARDHGRYLWLIGVAKGRGLVGQLREAANRSVIPAADNAAGRLLKDGDFEGLAAMLSDDNLHPNYRTPIGMKALDLLSSRGDLDSMLGWAFERKGLPGPVKAAASERLPSMLMGMETVVKMLVDEKEGKLMGFLKDTRIQEEARAKAGSILSEYHARRGDWERLLGISKDTDLPAVLREAASAGIGDAMARAKVAETFAGSAMTGKLVKFAMNKDLPEHVRIAMGLTALGIYELDGRTEALKFLADDAGPASILVPVREAARSALDRLGYTDPKYKEAAMKMKRRIDALAPEPKLKKRTGT